MATKEFQTKLMGLQANLLNFAYMLTSNRDNAYDLLQDTTLKALDNESKYVENTNFKGWVFTIMSNIFINKGLDALALHGVAFVKGFAPPGVACRFDKRHEL